MSGRYKSGGWYGNSHGHALAAKGIRLYGKKSTPHHEMMFYAQHKEEQIPMQDVMAMVRTGMTYAEMRAERPEVDQEILRLRGIKALDIRNGNNTLSTLNTNSVDESVQEAEMSNRTKESMKRAVNDHQMMSFLADVKAKSLKERIR